MGLVEGRGNSGLPVSAEALVQKTGAGGGRCGQRLKTHNAPIGHALLLGRQGGDLGAEPAGGGRHREKPDGGQLRQQGQKLHLMLSLERLGYTAETQSYPLPAMRDVYGSRGAFIAWWPTPVRPGCTSHGIPSRPWWSAATASNTCMCRAVQLSRDIS